MMHTYRIFVKGDKIHSQIIRYQIFSEKHIDNSTLRSFEKMKRADFLEYAANNNIRCIGQD